METLILTCSIVATIFSIVALILGICSLISIEAFKRSTHKIEYMPVPLPDFTKAQDKEFKETLNDDFTGSFII